MVCMQRIGACLTHAAHCSLARPRHRPKPYLLPQCNGRSARALSGALQQGRACTRCSKTRCTYSSSAERPLGKTCAARTAPARRPGRAPIVHAQSPASVRCHPRRRGPARRLQASHALRGERALAAGPGTAPDRAPQITTAGPGATLRASALHSRCVPRSGSRQNTTAQVKRHANWGATATPAPSPGAKIQAQRGAAPAP